MSPLVVAAVALGGAIGAVVRHLLTSALNQERMPRGTIIANVVGAAGLGATVAWAELRGLSDVALALVAVGLTGGLTTFSSLAVDGLKLAKAGYASQLGIYLLLTLGLGVTAAGAAHEFVVIALR